MHNASWRFADGYEYGRDDKIEMSNNKLNARGTGGIEGLSKEKLIV